MDNFSIKSKVEFKETDGKIFAEIQVFKKGKFKRPSFFGEDQEFTLGKKQFDKAITNFNSGVPSKEIPLNFQHNSGDPDPDISKAAGWFGSSRKGTELFARGSGLFARVEIMPETKEFIENEEFLFSSAEFSDDFKDEKGEDKGFTVSGLALTNIPFLRNMNKNKLLNTAFQFAEVDSKVKVFELEEIEENIAPTIVNNFNIQNKELSKMDTTKFIELAGVDTIDKALVYFTELKEKSDEEPEKKPGEGDEIVKLTAQVAALTADNTAKQTVFDAMIVKQNTIELNARKERLEKFFNDEFKIDAAQLADAIKAYVEVDSVQTTQELFDNYIKFVESCPSRDDLKEVEFSDGGGKEKGVDTLIDAYRKENKCTFTEAFDALKPENKELFEAYEKETNK